MNSNAIEHHFQHEFDIESIRDDPAGTLGSPTFAHDGQRWQTFVRCTDDHLIVRLALLGVTSTTDTKITFGVRILHDDDVHTIVPMEVHLEIPSIHVGDTLSSSRSVSWSRLEHVLFGGDQFTVDIVFFAMENGTTLESAAFKDVWVACENSTALVHCNKYVIGRESQAIFSAFSDESSVESATKTFTIRHASATAENVHLLVRCMYEHWVPELMDAHVFEIIQMAMFYDCRNVVAAAIQPIIRQLTTERFWKTSAIAVQLQAQQPTLFDACVDFAYCAGTLSLINRDDCTDDAVLVAIIRAMAAFH